MTGLRKIPPALLGFVLGLLLTAFPVGLLFFAFDEGKLRLLLRVFIIWLVVVLASLIFMSGRRKKLAYWILIGFSIGVTIATFGLLLTCFIGLRNF